MKFLARYRAVWVAALLALAWASTARSRDTQYRMKVMLVDHAAKRVEAKFIIAPEDLRIVCHGEAKAVFVGDYVKVEVNKDGQFVIAGTTCTEMAWLK